MLTGIVVIAFHLKKYTEKIVWLSSLSIQYECFLYDRQCFRQTAHTQDFCRFFDRLRKRVRQVSFSIHVLSALFLFLG